MECYSGGIERRVVYLSVILRALCKAVIQRRHVVVGKKVRALGSLVLVLLYLCEEVIHCRDDLL
jgi:hypothetical protein